MSKKHGWVLQMKQNSFTGPGQFYGAGEYCGPNVCDATVFPTRKNARKYLSAVGDEVVCKVSLDADDKPIEVIPGR